jgi:hypothetical protein
MQIAAPQILGSSNSEADPGSSQDALAVYSANALSRSPPTRCGTRRERSGLASVSLLPTRRRHPHTYSRPPTPKRSSPRGESSPSCEGSALRGLPRLRSSMLNRRLCNPRLWTFGTFRFRRKGFHVSPSPKKWQTTFLLIHTVHRGTSHMTVLLVDSPLAGLRRPIILPRLKLRWSMSSSAALVKKFRMLSHS